MISLSLKEHPTVPLEAECISPDVMANLFEAELAALPVFLGKRRHNLADFFTISGSGSDEIELNGDAGRVKWVGKGMTRGRIAVRGNVGMHLGAYMSGGRIDVSGDAGDWVGGEMKGGLIHIRGSAGGQLGAAYRGSITGLDGGAILVDGTAGIELGMRMKRGLIAVKGQVRDFAGLQMKGGTIALMNGAELRPGAWMLRGTIITLKPVRLLPTFAPSGMYNPTFLSIYAKHLHQFGFELPFDVRSGSYQRYAGDAAVPGKGEILEWVGA
ncbi:MAG TPA: formylmethanofuran dehydrogenase subunit C [Urbifossiella sp.]|nr:formylmethanofuran dehydrogenase subunit C [Urbifossiella sp.]